MPTELIAQYFDLPRFALVAARIGGMLMFIPALASMAVPTNLRVLLVLMLALLVSPVVAMPAALPDSFLGLLLGLALELALGILVGLVAVTCFIGLQMGALLVAQEAGLAFGQIVDPTSEEQETVLGVFYVQLGVVIFFVIGGHRALVDACLGTFRDIPLLGATVALDAAVSTLSRGLLLGCEVALRVAGPTLLTMLLVNVAMGFVSRTMPQLNVLAVGFSIKSLAAFIFLAVSLPVAANAFVGALEQSHEWLDALFHGG